MELKGYEAGRGGRPDSLACACQPNLDRPRQRREAETPAHRVLYENQRRRQPTNQTTNEGNKQKTATNAVAINPTASILILHVTDLNVPMKAESLPEWIHKPGQLDVAYETPTLNIRLQTR